MSLTDKELRAEKAEQYINDYGYVTVNSLVTESIEDYGIFVKLDDCNEGVLPIEEATALRDGLTVVIDQYHDFIARRDAKTNQEIIDEMEPGTVFEYQFRGVVREYVKLRDERIWGRGSSLNYISSEFQLGTITVVNQ